MLVLTRKVGEAIALGEGIKVKVIEIKGNQVRLGIEAPADVRIYREEVFQKVQAENRQASSWDLTDFTSVLSILDQKIGKES